MTDILLDYNHRVTLAHDVASMRDYLQNGGHLDCVIVDALLPCERGVTLAEVMAVATSRSCFAQAA